MLKDDRNYQFKLVVAGQDILTGDRLSTAVIFRNMTGENFANKVRQEYQDYMTLMEAELKIDLLGNIKLLNPEGKVLREGEISRAVRLGLKSPQESTVCAEA